MRTIILDIDITLNYNLIRLGNVELTFTPIQFHLTLHTVYAFTRSSLQDPEVFSQPTFIYNCGNCRSPYIVMVKTPTNLLHGAGLAFARQHHFMLSMQETRGKLEVAASI